MLQYIMEMRYGAGRAYLDDIKNKSNIEIFTHSNVSKILFKNKVAIGVEVLIIIKKKFIMQIKKYYYQLDLLILPNSSAIRYREC